VAATCVNSAKGEAAGSNTVNTSGATFTSAATGSTFFVQVHCDPAITITIPADSKGNAYTLVKRQTSGSTSCAVYKCENGVGGAGHYATANLSAGNFPAILFTEWSDTGKTVVVDTASLVGASDTSSPFTVTSGTFDATSTAAYLGTSDDATGSPITKSESTGFSSVIQATDDNNFYGGSVWQKTLSGTGALTPSITYSTGTIVGCALVIFGLKSVSSGITLTGVSGAGAVGSVSPGTANAVTGNSGTASAGTVSPASSKALTGVSGTSSAGTVGPNVTVALTGVSATATAGTVTPTTGIFVALTGVTGTGSVGTVSPVVDKALSGVSGTSSVGTVAPSSVKALTGNSSTGSVGTVSPALSAGVTGVSGTGSAGSTAGSTSVALSGVAGTGSVGTVTADAGGTIVALSGVSATGSVGQPGVDIVVSLTGVTGTGIAGSVSPPSTTSGGDAWGREKKKRRAQVQAEVNARNLEIIRAELAQEVIEIEEEPFDDDDEEALMLLL
jgi:hypothetical protein